MKKSCHISFALLLMLSFNTAARDLTMTESIKLAIEHSYSLRVAQEQRNALEESYKAATAQRWPTLSATVTVLYKSEVTDFSIGLPSVQREFGTKENYQTDFRISIPLFTGSKITGGIGSADALRKLADATERQALETTVYQARVGHLDLIKADRIIGAAVASHKRATITYRDILARLDAGAADSVDLFDARLLVANADLTLMRANTNRKEAEVRLATILGIPLSESLTIHDTLTKPDIVAIQKADINETKPEILAANAQVKQSSSQLTVAKSEFFPTVLAHAGYSYGKPNLDPFNKTWNDYFTIGATLSWSFNVGNSAGNKIRQAQYFYNSFRIQRDDIKEQLKRNADISWETLKLAFTRYEISSESFQLASRNYRLAVEQHKYGVLSSNRLLEIETSLSVAEAEMATALVDYYITLSTYYINIGSEDLFEGTK